MAAKKKAAKAGAGAYAAGKAVRENPYVHKLIEDDGLRDDLRDAYDSARKAYTRLNGKGPAKALEDKKVQKELEKTASSLKSAADTLRGPVKGKRRKRKSLLGIVIVGGVVALVASEGLRKKVLDALFGAEEEFEYTSTTTPSTSQGSQAKETAGA